MSEQYAALRGNVNLLGQLLGQTIKDAQGQAILDKVEEIRALSKSSRSGNEDDRQALIDVLHALSDEELLPVARSFNHFLNLANVAEQFHTVSRFNDVGLGQQNPLTQTLKTLVTKAEQGQLDSNHLAETLSKLHINLVLTAHPTEVTRRTIINKHVELSDCLASLERKDNLPLERDAILNRIEQLISQAWHTDDIRRSRPTPVDEAKWGYAVIENSLWHAVPRFLREFSANVKEQLSLELPKDYSPIEFTSWMGGDRDGNPFVTSQVTAEVLDHGRWMALNLYIQDLKTLCAELSMSDASDELIELAGQDFEPYRAVIKKLKNQVAETVAHLGAKIKNKRSDSQDLITDINQLKHPVEVCYRSLLKCNMKVVADGLLLDLLYRINSFGLRLAKLDVRQDSSRHSDVFSELTRYLGLGDYNQWQEQDKQAFLLTELNSRRPLIPKHWQPSPDVQEVLDTFDVIAKQDEQTFGLYIISMARTASDILAVQLLLKESGCSFDLPVAPLFETLDDLNAGSDVITTLLDNVWYRGHIKNTQNVMIGYSDSAKDAGMMAAGWAQYEAMDKLVQLADERGIELILFHGRGGTVGRGGAPAAQALHSQPPGSLKGGLRVTEQGEMIRFKFGLPDVALQSLNIYAGAVLQSNLLPPPEPKPQWREVMKLISEESCEHYRNVVRHDENFVPYFRMATPELELSKLPLGSRPAKRNPNGGVESLRAIPWIFAWSQNRLMLPAWLGALTGLKAALNKYGAETLNEMSLQWPFFRSRLEMLEMVFSKADCWLSEHYDNALVEDMYKPLGVTLRKELQEAISLVQSLSPQKSLLAEQPWIKESISLRNPYTDPLNLLQVELLRRARSEEKRNEGDIDNALMITMTGIAAGMRNTG
ncbi:MULTISPECIES: phosphoenolpyruvate carboxylase [Pseudoalteromonas]|jgi:phosphoenolpyruvate carboxylase|uniref:Phosphoenolpyruvate carboxylase n=1 Tax=Pseudoalteromonas distincta TaxID=77608 RepID=F3BH89_9GAMM|nr:MULTISPECIES: phosphoenolpyruvate carboxylase [Pseudoalteromonas]EGI74054.1 phosphoenolpyruvate carboxylase [Pseudoalteromonas distincta]KAA1153046.1 phosphoenolpyruvate carboxylase [Pseudoalteromonas distincta]MBB1278117.1 phosphoenolpyruvate carboxylase [Pseudoalteromonas sp. SR43-3]MBB1278892.1 phosphoenolpyruvate carboxylase [Pseudoalteromonas sp. SR41-1]MBB1297393.1 phosphoenolpyruvate carboxylase [Pseudoalteromonas sp. SR41-7]|tara:strand:- start:18139 stop:20784 length:2646 start_codon:yes stop_codon:yes gene_type:complete